MIKLKSLESFFCKYERLTTQLLEKGFERWGVDRTLFIHWSKYKLLITQIYVDNIVFGATSSDFTLNFTEEMKKEFKMSMVGGLNFSLELQIRQLKDDIFFLSQSKYAKELVKKFGLESTKHSRTTMSTTTKFCKDTSRKDVEQKLYRSIIRSLLYLIVSCPNISFSVDTYAKYQANPKESHLTFVKRIIRYISGTLNYGLWCSSCVIVRYFNGDWIGNIKHRKNTYCACFFVGNCLVTWLSKKQNLISLSIVKAECIVVGSCCT